MFRIECFFRHTGVAPVQDGVGRTTFVGQGLLEELLRLLEDLEEEGE